MRKQNRTRAIKQAIEQQSLEAEERRAGILERKAEGDDNREDTVPMTDGPSTARKSRRESRISRRDSAGTAFTGQTYDSEASRIENDPLYPWRQPRPKPVTMLLVENSVVSVDVEEFLEKLNQTIEYDAFGNRIEMEDPAEVAAREAAEQERRAKLEAEHEARVARMEAAAAAAEQEDKTYSRARYLREIALIPNWPSVRAVNRAYEWVLLIQSELKRVNSSYQRRVAEASSKVESLSGLQDPVSTHPSTQSEPSHDWGVSSEINFSWLHSLPMPTRDETDVPSAGSPDSTTLPATDGRHVEDVEAEALTEQSGTSRPVALQSPGGTAHGDDGDGGGAHTASEDSHPFPVEHIGTGEDKAPSHESSATMAANTDVDTQAHTVTVPRLETILAHTTDLSGLAAQDLREYGADLRNQLERLEWVIDQKSMVRDEQIFTKVAILSQS